MANTATAPAPIEEKPLTVEVRLGRNAVSDDTRNYVALAQKADSNRSVAWAVAVGSWLNDCTDDSGRLPVDIHGSVAKGDNVKCQTIKSKITEEFATTVGGTGSRVRQIVSGLYWHSGERGDPLNGFLKVNKRAPKGWESVGGCVTVNWGVLTSAIQCEQFEVEKQKIIDRNDIRLSKQFGEFYSGAHAGQAPQPAPVAEHPPAVPAPDALAA